MFQLRDLKGGEIGRTDWMSYTVWTAIVRVNKCTGYVKGRRGGGGRKRRRRKEEEEEEEEEEEKEEEEEENYGDDDNDNEVDVVAVY